MLMQAVQVLPSGSGRDLARAGGELYGCGGGF